MTVEVELRFRAEAAALVALAERRRLGPAELGPPTTVDEVDRYLDTDDGRFAAARWALRLRHRDGADRVSLKGPPEASSDPALHRRPEIEGPADGDADPAGWTPSSARDLVDRIRSGRPLVERFRLRQRRTERTVRIDRRRIGTLTLDEVEVAHDDASYGTLHVAELELGGDEAVEQLGALSAALGAIDGLAPEPRTKLELALERLARP